MLEVDTPTAKATSAGHILLVDDEPQVLAAYGRVLRSAGFSVVQLADGRQVESALDAMRFDAVISDIALPGTSGIDILRAVRQRDADLPVVLMTAVGDLSSAVKAIEYGAARYLLKPIVPAFLTETAADAIRVGRIAKLKQEALCGRGANELAESAELSRRFERALETLHMAYQPIVRWSAHSVFAHEALVRTEEASLKRPDAFFAAAEGLGRLRDIGRTIRRRVAETIENTGAECVFVNLHPCDLQDEDLFLQTSPLTQVASRVVLEITERASLESIEDVRARIGALRQIGFRVAVDDLGAGYAGLTTFAQLQPEVVKLDMSLIRGIDSDPMKGKLVRSIGRLCDDLGMLVVAEGVETTAERDALVAAGCDLLQGYLFAKPGAPFPAARFDF